MMIFSDFLLTQSDSIFPNVESEIGGVELRNGNWSQINVTT